MGLLSVKDYLTLNELANYLNNHGEYFNLSSDYDFDRLKRLILDLMNEKKLNVVFCYNGMIVFDMNKFTYTEGVETLEEIELFAIGYFYLDFYNVKEILLENKQKKVDGYFHPYYIFDEVNYPIIKEPETGLKDGDEFTSFNLLDEPLNIDDLRFPKADLDKLFNQPTAQTPQLQAQIDRLTDENQQQADTIRQLNERLEAGTPAEPIADKEPLNNTERNNLQKAVIAKTNNLLAKAVKSLDRNNQLTKDDLCKFIQPFSLEMALCLTDDITKAEKLLVTDETIKDKHMAGIDFKKGRVSDEEKAKKYINLEFDRTKLPTTE